jgi:glyoxylase-like metal-dependent hydrolase (beta-lactamase superfamily II)
MLRYVIYIPLPNNPLKNLNCYVVKTPDKNLIIDTGFNMPECFKALREGLDELEIDIEKTDLFLTHNHADHSGLANKIMNKDSIIYMSRIDYEYMLYSYKGLMHEKEALYESEGFPIEELNEIRSINPAKVYASNKPFNAVTFDDLFKFNIGEYEFTAILTPGHTPGHSCLYLEKENIMFTGDHILFDITSNITNWPFVQNSLKDYIKSLEKIKKYNIKKALPGHRNNSIDVYERIDQILLHHKIRLQNQNILNIIISNPGLDATQIASKIKWSMRGKNWSEFPIPQKYFALGETLSHLDYLVIENTITKQLENGLYKYYVNNNANS